MNFLHTDLIEQRRMSPTLKRNEFIRVAPHLKRQSIGNQKKQIKTKTNEKDREERNPSSKKNS